MSKPFLHGINYVLPENTKRKQDINVLRHNYIGPKEHQLPPDSPGAYLLRAFDSIFRKNANIAEGVLTDVIWGLRQSADFKDEIIGAALTQLKNENYIYYTDPEGNKLSEVELIESGKPIWIRYTDKFLNCFAAA